MNEEFDPRSEDKASVGATGVITLGRRASTWRADSAQRKRREMKKVF